MWKSNIDTFTNLKIFRKPVATPKEETFKLEPRQPPTVMPNIKPRPNLHAQHHNLDTLERLVFEDFNATPYTSKGGILTDDLFSQQIGRFLVVLGVILFPKLIMYLLSEKVKSW